MKIVLIIFSLCISQLVFAQEPTGSFSCKVDGTDWIPKEGQRNTGLLTYKMQADTTKPKEEAIFITQTNNKQDLLMVEIPYKRESSLPIDGVKVALTIGQETFSALINHLELNQSLSPDGKRAYLSGVIPKIELTSISLNAKKKTITDLRFANIKVTLKMF